MNMWIWENGKKGKCISIFAPVKLVELRLKDTLLSISYPPQTASLTGASHLTYAATGGELAALPAVILFKSKDWRDNTAITKVDWLTGIHLRDLPFSALVGKAETSTELAKEKVENNRNSTSVTNHPFRGVESTKILHQ